MLSDKGSTHLHFQNDVDKTSSEVQRDATKDWACLAQRRKDCGGIYDSTLQISERLSPRGLWLCTQHCLLWPRACPFLAFEAVNT